MGLGQFPGDGQAKARTTRPTGTCKGLEQPLLRPLWNPRAIVTDGENGLGGLLDEGDAHLTARTRGILLQGLPRIPHEIGQYAVQLIRIGHDLGRGVDFGHQPYGSAQPGFLCSGFKG